ncbi:FAS1-like dehydratase domain-containing protein, partial [Klebsiella pneumoniae]|uniref:FAS1-like dehydratase domain-containing protein n=1 Tax=Klebsiella pneumoniae TaxID=573 RepID=UPI003F51DA0C
QHMIFGGDEWWLFGGRIEPGDSVMHDPKLFCYKVSETKFAGPTMFSRGDTTYANQRGQVLCKQRSTSVRYLAENARKLGMFKDNVPRTWTD